MEEGEVLQPTEEGSESHDESTEPAEETLDLAKASAILEATSGPENFDVEYEAAVFVTGGYLLEEAMAAMRANDPAQAMSATEQALQIHNRHLEIVKSAAKDANHPMQESLPGSQELAEEALSLLAWIHQVANALLLFRQGEWGPALEALDHNGAVVNLGDAQALSVRSLSTAAAGEMLTAEIRAAVNDFAGARSAYDRAESLFDKMLRLADEESGDDTPPQYLVTLCQGMSLRMQLAQLFQANDYSQAAEVARTCSERLSTSADQWLEFDQESRLLMIPLIEAMAEEQLGRMEEAKAEVALEESDWAGARERAKQASTHYSEGGKTSLNSSLPTARVMQEKLLNTGFQWEVQFRRRLEREQAASKRYEELQTELKELSSSIRSALTPTGITVNNQAEMVSSVQQQVEVVTQIEASARTALRDLPTALDESGLPAEVVDQLSNEARELAGAPETGPTFLSKVKGFAKRLETTLEKAGAGAGAIMTIAKALSLLI